MIKFCVEEDMAKRSIFETEKKEGEPHYKIRQYTGKTLEQYGDKLEIRKQIRGRTVDYIIDRTKEFEDFVWTEHACMELEQQCNTGERVCDKKYHSQEKALYVIKGTHYPGDCVKYWKAPGVFNGEIKKGDFVYVNTRYGEQAVLVEDVIPIETSGIAPIRKVERILTAPGDIERARYDYTYHSYKQKRGIPEAEKRTVIVTHNETKEHYPYAVVNEKYQLIAGLRKLGDARKIYAEEIKKGQVELVRDLKYTVNRQV